MISQGGDIMERGDIMDTDVKCAADVCQFNLCTYKIPYITQGEKQIDVTSIELKTKSKCWQPHCMSSDHNKQANFWPRLLTGQISILHPVAG